MQGKVKMFQPAKGYGFIISEDGKEVFFHYSQLLMEGYKRLNRIRRLNLKSLKRNVAYRQTISLNCK